MHTCSTFSTHGLQAHARDARPPPAKAGAGALVFKSADGHGRRGIGGSKGDNQRGAFVVLLYMIVIIRRPEDSYDDRPTGRGAGCRRRSVHKGLAPRSLRTEAYPNRLLFILGRRGDKWERCGWTNPSPVDTAQGVQLTFFQRFDRQIHDGPRRSTALLAALFELHTLHTLALRSHIGGMCVWPRRGEDRIWRLQHCVGV